MEFEKQIPEWVNEGDEPSETLRTSGFEAGNKPPANIFNWLFNLVFSAIKEIQSKLSKVDNTADSEKAVAFASEAGVGRKVEYDLKVRFNGGSTEGTDMWTYNGSTSRSVNITPAKIGASPVSHNHTNYYGAVQLGEGEDNKMAGTFQVFDHTLMYSDGTIPLPRLSRVKGKVADCNYYTGNGGAVNTRFAELGYIPTKIEIVPATAGNFSVTTLIAYCPFSSIMRSSNEAYGISLEWTENGVTMTPCEPDNSNAPTVVCEAEGVQYYYVIYD